MPQFEIDVHSWLVHQAGGKQKNVKGVSQTTLSKMKLGESAITSSNLIKLLEENSHEAVVIIKSKSGGRTTIKLTKNTNNNG